MFQELLRVCEQVIWNCDTKSSAGVRTGENASLMAPASCQGHQTLVVTALFDTDLAFMRKISRGQTTAALHEHNSII
jgi:hypothetical protein